MRPGIRTDFVVAVVCFGGGVLAFLFFWPLLQYSIGYWITQ
jgi:hypothetical protein